VTSEHVPVPSVIWLIDHGPAHNILAMGVVMASLLAMPSIFPWWGLLVLAAVFWLVQAFVGNDENPKAAANPRRTDVTSRRS
jgi:hypothetical protein